LNNEELITKIANVVVQKISNQTPIPNNDLSPQIPLIQDANSSSNVLPYDNIITKNDESDGFDEKRLLNIVPNGYKTKAKRLLELFNDEGQITFNSRGIVFINGESLPDSNIFQLFPFLFQKRKPSNIPGLLDLVEAIKRCGYSNYINISKSTTKLKNSTNKNNSNISTNYWFLGN
jgi:hypothetical protein